MTLYALDAIDDALEATRAFLWPFDLGRWARLAVVALFVGGASGFNPFQFAGSTPSNVGTDAPGGPGAPGASDVLPSIAGPELAIVAAVAALVVALGLVFGAIGATMEFVFVESLRRESVTIRRYWSARWRQGLRLFGFRLAVGLLSLAAVAGALAAIFAPLLFGDGGFSLGMVLLAIPVFGVVALASGLVNGFTTAFVVPIMIAEDRALLSAWRRFWPTVTDQWKQYGAFAVVGFVLQIAAGIAASIATVLGAIVVAIPLAIVGLVGWQVLAVSQVVGWLLVALAVALFVLAMVVLTLFVSVPVQTFLRYYALFVLGDTNDAFDLVAERRRAIRE